MDKTKKRISQNIDPINIKLAHTTKVGSKNIWNRKSMDAQYSRLNTAANSRKWDKS